MIWFHIHYLVEEISTWRAGELEAVAVNTRYLVGSRIIRQRWDMFRRDKDAMRAQRVQAKTLADFRRRHPASFGIGIPQHSASPGLTTIRPHPPTVAPISTLRARAAVAEIAIPARPGLLLGQMAAAGWPGRGGVPARLQGRSAGGPADHGGHLDWRHIVAGAGAVSGAERGPPSSPRPGPPRDGRLLQLAFDLHEPRGSARGLIRQEGCEGPLSCRARRHRAGNANEEPGRIDACQWRSCRRSTKPQ